MERIEDKENSLLIFKKSKTPIKKRTLEKPILPRRQSKDLKQKSLPDLNIEKTKLTEYFKTYQPIGKEILQEDILKLKQRNNDLLNENTRLKTVIVNLQKDNSKFQKLIMDNRTPQSNKILGECNIMSLKQLLRQCKKQLMDQKNQNISIKKSLKYSKMGQLQLENKYLKEQTLRLRNLLGIVQAEGTSKVISQKQIQQISVAKKFNLNLNRKPKFMQQKMKDKTQKDSQSIIDNLKKIIKQKQTMIQSMKIDGIKFKVKPRQFQIKCYECQKLKSQITQNKAKIKQLEEKTKCVINNNSSTVIINNNSPMNVQNIPKPSECQYAKPQNQNQKHENENFDSEPQVGQSGFKMTRPSAQFYQSLKEFLKYRFQAHHLSLQQLKSYMEQQVDEMITVDVFAELCLVEPFSIGNRDYLGALIGYLFYQDNLSQSFVIKDSDTKPSQYIISKLQNFLGEYQILDIKRQQEMYMQIAELITNYQKHIETALKSKRNNDGTISKKILENFLVQIQLDQEYIDFIISQIILDSIDMDHLSYNSLFDIFIVSANVVPDNFRPNQCPYGEMGSSQMGKSVYTVMPVKQLDEQYEQSQQSQQLKQGIQDKQKEIEPQTNNIEDQLNQNEEYNLCFQEKCQQIQEYEPINDWADQQNIQQNQQQ